MRSKLLKFLALSLLIGTALPPGLLAAQPEPVYRGSDFWHGYRNPERFISLFHGTFSGEPEDLYFRRALVAYVTIYDEFCRKSFSGEVGLFVDGERVDKDIDVGSLDEFANLDLLKKLYPTLVIVDQRYVDLYHEYYQFLEIAEVGDFLGRAAANNPSPWWEKPRFHMQKFFQQVPCASLEIRQLGENLLRIARRQPRLIPPGIDQKREAELLSVVDPATGLMWTRRDTGFTVNYDQAGEHCRDLEIDGKEWRLPTIEELEHLHDYDIPGHACKGHTCHLRLGIKVSEREVLSASGVAIRFDHGNRYPYGRYGVALCVSESARGVEPREIGESGFNSPYQAIYEEGKALENQREYHAAAEKFRLAGTMGHVEAQYALGLLFVNGKLTNSRREGQLKAVEWLRLAATQDHLDAQHRLGVVLEFELREVAEAIEWYESAARQGHQGAIDELSRLKARPAVRRGSG